MTDSKIKKHIAFPKTLVKLAERQADTMGFGFAEYLRYLIAKDTEKYRETIEVVDKQTQQEVYESLEDLKKGNYVITKNRKEMEDYLLK